jgi:hypothetical protein
MTPSSNCTTTSSCIISQAKQSESSRGTVISGLRLLYKNPAGTRKAPETKLRNWFVAGQNNVKGMKIHVNLHHEKSDSYIGDMVPTLGPLGYLILYSRVSEMANQNRLSRLD